MTWFRRLDVSLSKSFSNWLSGHGRIYWRRFSGPVFIILAIVVTLVIFFIDGQQILNYTFQLNPALVLLSVVIEFSGLILAVPAWHLILARFGSRLSYQDDLRIYCYTILGIVIPGGVWSLVGRVALYERQGVPGMYVTVATVVEFMLIGLAGLAVYGLTIFIQPAETIWQRPGIALLVMAMTLILVQPPVFNRIATLILSRSNPINAPLTLLSYKDLGVLLGLEILTLIIGGTAIYVLLQSFVIAPASLYITMVRAWAAGAVVSNLLFWLPGKPVLRDGAIIVVLAQTLPVSLAVGFVIILRAWTIMSVLLAAGLAWLFLRRKPYLPTE